jgi:hypothetical protein
MAKILIGRIHLLNNDLLKTKVSWNVFYELKWISLFVLVKFWNIFLLKIIFYNVGDQKI